MVARWHARIRKFRAVLRFRGWVATALCLAGAFAALPAVASAAGRCGDPAARPWCDASLPADQRAGLLLAELTPEERISLLGGDERFGVAGAEDTHTGTSTGVERLGLPTIYFSDGPVGPRSGQATALPTPLALAATFDPRMAAMHGGVIADEVRHKGNDVVFAPTIETLRTPLAGRSFENYGEDPYLSSRLAVAWIRAAQELGVIASVKHYVPNSQEGTGPFADQARPGVIIQALGTYATEGNRMQVNANVDERTMREIYLPQFEAAVKQGNAGSVMCAYNKLNGPYACESEEILERILRDDWGFDGFVLADYNAVHDAGASLRNGLDFEPWPGIVYGSTSVQAALASGGATMDDVDERIGNYLRTLFAYGAFDREAFAADEAAIDVAAHSRAARKIEQSAITLLRNDGLLPLDAKELDSIAVIGPGANRYVTGGGSSEIKPFSFTTPLDAITRRAGPGVEVRHSTGEDPAEAAELAASSDVAVVLAPDFETEGVDRRCLELECPPVYGDLDGLIESVAAANPRTAVVLETGAPVLTPWRGAVGALLEAWYPGAEGGSAIARVLFGDVDPGGRLPATFPDSEADLPTAGNPKAYPGVDNQLDYPEGVFVGYRHYDENGIRPAFPFGHGLSYTRFRFSDLTVEPGRGRKLAVARVRVENTGDRRGVAVPQLYVGLPDSERIPQPPAQLKGTAKLSLGPGASSVVSFPLRRRDLSYWDPEAHRWRIAAGCHRLLAGRSSRRLPLRAELEVGGADCGRGAVPVKAQP